MSSYLSYAFTLFTVFVSTFTLLGISHTEEHLLGLAAIYIIVLIGGIELISDMKQEKAEEAARKELAYRK